MNHNGAKTEPEWTPDVQTPPHLLTANVRILVNDRPRGDGMEVQTRHGQPGKSGKRHEKGVVTVC